MEQIYTVSFLYLKDEVHLKLLIAQSKFSGPSTSRYQWCEKFGDEMERKVENMPKLCSLLYRVH